MAIRLIVADDHRLMRDSLRGVLERDSSLKVVGEAEDGEGALAMTAQLRPDLVLMDVSMPRLNGIDATRKIIEAGFGTKVIIVTVHCDWRIAAESLQAGASAYILKSNVSSEITTAITAVLAGDRYVSSALNDPQVLAVLSQIRQRDMLGAFTAQDWQLVQLLAAGRDHHEAASTLGLSDEMIESCRQRVLRTMEKLSVSGFAELVRLSPEKMALQPKQ